MTAVRAAAAPRSAPAGRGHLRAAARLLRLELRRNAMPGLLPVAACLFWFTGYRKAMAQPPLWSLRAASMQTGAILAFAWPVAGTAAWLGSRDARRRTTDLVTITARPPWARLLATWAATTCWALLGYLGCVAALYGVTARQIAWGGPLWWPVAVVVTALTAASALGFAAGTLVPGRFTAPVAALATFFALALSTQPIHGSGSSWLVTPIVTGPWDLGPNADVATFYPYLPDLAIAQIMFATGLAVAVLGALVLLRGPGAGWPRTGVGWLRTGARWLRRPAAAVTAAGLLAAGAAVALTGTGRLTAHGMIAIPALHDAASDRPLRYRPVCSHTAVPVCLHPAFAGYLPAVTTALAPVLGELAGLPGGPARISQAAPRYRQGAGNSVSVGPPGPAIGGTPPVFRLLLPDQLPGLGVGTAGLAAVVRPIAGPAIVASVTGDGPGASRAQWAVAVALSRAAGLPAASFADPRARTRKAAESMPAAVQAAVRRFAALSPSGRHAWLVRHLAALRAGRITLAEVR